MSCDCEHGPVDINILGDQIQEVKLASETEYALQEFDLGVIDKVV